MNPDTKIYVSMSDYETYKQAEVWKDLSLFVKPDFYANGIGYAISANNECWAVDYKGTAEDIIVPTCVEHPATGMNYPVTTIGSKLFCDNSDVRHIVVSEGIRSIGNSVCQHCWNLRTITLPSTLKELGTQPFYGCYRLAAITNYAKTPQPLTDHITNYDYPKLYVPYGSYDNYAKADYWRWCEIEEINKPDPTEPSPVKGDLNGDGEVDIVDVVTLVDIILNK